MKLINLQRILFSVLLLLCGQSAAAPDASNTSVNLTEEDQNWLKSHPVIRIAPDPNHAPVEWFNDEGEFNGISSDYIKLLGERLGITFEIIRGKSWNDLLVMAKNRQVDMLTAIVESQSRDTYLLFSQPYLEIKRAIFSSKDMPRIRQLEDLKGYKVAVVEGDWMDEKLSLLSDEIKLERFHDLKTALIASSRGVTDVTVSSKPSSIYYIKNEGLLNLKIVSELPELTLLRYGIRNDWPQFVSILDKGLASISPAENKHIHDKWIKLYAPRFWDNPLYKNTSLLLFALFLLIFTAGVVWTKTLNSRVKQRSQELKDTQMQLIQAEKLESIGRIAAGVAHEVKNPLAIIQMGADYLSQVVPEDETTKAVIDDIDDAVQRADSVIKGLLDFSRDKELGLEPGNINEVIKNSLQMVAHEMRLANIEVKTDLADKLPEIDLDANKLQQVLINLFMNSVHAMERDGVLTVSSYLKTLNSSADLACDHENRFKMGDNVLWVEVEDTGTGFNEEDKVKIFDPFYTTKPEGEGTGLGLSVSRNIINLHEGSMDIRNRNQGGASAVIMFKITRS